MPFCFEDIILGGDNSAREFEGTDEPQNSLCIDISYLHGSNRLASAKNTSLGVLLSDLEWLGRPSQELQALRHRCLRHLSRLRRPVPLIQAIKEAQEKSSTGPARRTFADE